MVSELVSMQKPAVTTMLVGFLEKHMGADIKAAVIQGLEGQGKARRGINPQLRAALEKFVVDDPDAQLREQGAKALQALPASR
jgi:hypothetical protein